MRSVRNVLDALESRHKGLPPSTPSCPVCPPLAHILSPRRKRPRGNRPAGDGDDRRRPGGDVTQQTFLQKPDGEIRVLGESAPLVSVVVDLQRVQQLAVIKPPFCSRPTQLGGYWTMLQLWVVADSRGFLPSSGENQQLLQDVINRFRETGAGQVRGGGDFSLVSFPVFT